MVSIIELKKYMVNTGIFDIVISKLYHRKKLCPIFLPKVDKGLEVDFHGIILPLSLTICLWVKGGEKFPLDVKEIV